MNSALIMGLGTLLLCLGIYAEYLGSQTIKSVNKKYKDRVTFPSAKTMIRVMYGKKTYHNLKLKHKQYAYWLNIIGDIISMIGFVIIIATMY